MSNWMRIFALAVLCTFATGPAHADLINFDFEDAPVGFPDAPTGLVFGPGESLVWEVEPVSGDVYTLRVSRPGSFFTLTDLSPFGGPPTWGSVSLDPFVDYLNPAPFLFEVLTLPAGMAVLQSTVEYGDFGPSDDDYVTGEVNALLENEAIPGFSTATLGSLQRTTVPSSGPLFVTDATGGSITAGGFQDHTLWWDNFTIEVVAADDLPDTLVAPAFSYISNSFIPGYIPGATIPDQPTPIPEPGTWALLSGGLLAVFALRRRRR